MSDDDTIIVRTFQHRGEEPTHWVQLEDVAELVKAAQDADAAYLAFEVLHGTGQNAESQALRLAMNVLRSALAPFERATSSDESPSR